jgi:nucleoside-diphosphate-sugar epimerase
MSLHVIVGAGAVGRGTAQHLLAAGHEVRLISRSGAASDISGVEVVAADAGDADRLAELCAAAESLYNCANPAYHQWAKLWPPLAASFLAAAEISGAKLITMSNLYGYTPTGKPMAATDELIAPSKKGQIRVDMWRDALAAHDAGRIRTAEVRASDYFGPGLGGSAHLGDRVVPKVMAGKAVSLLGNPDATHSWSYIDDVCAVMGAAGTNDAALGRAWHVPTAPSKSAREMVAALADAAGVDAPAVRSVPASVIKVVGLVVPLVRELPEVRYQFEEPFVIDATDTEAQLGLTYTAFGDQVQATLASYGLKPHPAAA